jgi:DNA-binding response OmpR family regulator
MSVYKILLAEDDENLGSILSDYLQLKGYHVTHCENGEIAYQRFTENSYDICIFDVMMPLKDGFTLVQEIRKINKKVPIIFLTAKSQKEDTLQGLKIGADDYLTKPFVMEELLLRINAIMRRTGATTPQANNSLIKVGIFTLDTERRILQNNEKTTRLTHKESELLRLLAENKNEVVERQALLQAIWKDDSYFNGRSMDVYMAKIRKYLSEDPQIEILNIHSVGFKLIDRS